LHRSIKAIEFAESLGIEGDIANFHVRDGDTTGLKMGVNEGGAGFHKLMLWNDNKIRILVVANVPWLIIDEIFRNTPLQLNK
jgi:hypothetical protein